MKSKEEIITELEEISVADNVEYAEIGFNREELWNLIKEQIEERDAKIKELEEKLDFFGLEEIHENK